MSNTSGVAKLAEQSMAVSEFILAGMLLNTLFFTFLRLGNRRAPTWPAGFWVSRSASRQPGLATA